MNLLIFVAIALFSQHFLNINNIELQNYLKGPILLRSLSILLVAMKL